MEKEKKNGKGETMKKPARFQEDNKFMRGMGRADQILQFRVLQEYPEMD